MLYMYSNSTGELRMAYREISASYEIHVASPNNAGCFRYRGHLEIGGVRFDFTMVFIALISVLPWSLTIRSDWKEVVCTRAGYAFLFQEFVRLGFMLQQSGLQSLSGSGR